MTALGLGKIKVIIEVTREDGTTSRLTINQIACTGSHPDDAADLATTTTYDGDDLLGKSPVVSHVAHRVDLHLAGQLESVDETGTLYTYEADVS